MAGALKWHESGKKYFEGGVSKVALYPMSGSTYGTGVAWNGVTAINENPSGADITDLYADDEKYASLQAAEKFGFSIEAYQSPAEFDQCDGSAEANGAAGVYLGQQSRKAFGLVYKTKIGSDTNPGMDADYKLHIIYNSLASPSGRQYQTINENPDAMTMSWDCNSTPAVVTGHKSVSKITIDSRDVPKATGTGGDAKTNLEKLEDIFYGVGTNATPKFLTPDQVIKVIKTGSLT